MEEIEKRFNDRTELARHLSDISRNEGKVSFVITYTGTDGNIGIDKAFQKFCYDETNNEYLAGISKLLQIKEHYDELKRIDEVVATFEERLIVLEDLFEKAMEEGNKKESGEENENETF